MPVHDLRYIYPDRGPVPVRKTCLANPLHSATYRGRDVDALTLVRSAWAAIDGQGLVDEIQDDLDGLVLPPRPEAAARTVPLPSIAAVLVTAIYLRYVCQDPTPNEVLWALHHYWAAEEAEALQLTAWQRVIDEARSDGPAVRAGRDYLVTWIAAVLESADGLIA